MFGQLGILLKETCERTNKNVNYQSLWVIVRNLKPHNKTLKGDKAELGWKVNLSTFN